jgi:succinoglycan biosynthesis transport protein ExoP
VGFLQCRRNQEKPEVSSEREVVHYARAVADDVTLLVLFRDLLRRWKAVVLVAVAVVAATTAYATSLPDEYTSSVVMSFAPKPEAAVGADTVRVVLPRYVAYVTSRSTTNRVAASVGERARVLADAVDASVTADSANLTISVTLPTGRRATDAANALAADALAFAGADKLLDAVIVAQALPPSVPSGPPRRLYQLAGVTLGLLLGAAGALLLERGRPRIRSWRDISLVTGYPVVGRIPPVRALRGSPVEALADPAVGAAVRTLRTNLERISREQPVHVLVVTSSLPGEGKTTVAGALAVTLAHIDAHVLLIDADLRRPGVRRVFPGPDRPGLAEVLHDKADLEQTIQRSPAPNLALLPTAADPDAGDLLARRFVDVLRKARERFDVIVVDAPPLLGGDDARTLATLCDGALLVVATDTLNESAAEAAAALDALGVRVLGAVANRARDQRGFGSYGSYGSYGSRT